MTVSTETALFHRDGDWLVPTTLTTGPWRSDAMHGGPPSAVIGLAIEAATEPDDQVARITIELEAPVPLEPLRCATTRTQISRRVGRLDIALVTPVRQVCSARVLLLRGDPIPEPAWVPPSEDFSVPGPEARYAWDARSRRADDTAVFHRDGSEHRLVSGGYGTAGPGVCWIRMAFPLVEGEPTSALCGLLAAADFGSALSGSLPRQTGRGVGLINVDVSLAIARDPVGEWFRLDSTALVDPAGWGLAMTRLADTAGHLGVLHQSQLGYHFRR